MSAAEIDTRTTDAGDGYTIIRVEAGTAYARNGNQENPTKRYRWRVQFNGRTIGTVNRFRHAADLIEIHKADPS